MKKIFITGASGFIGGAITKKLAKDNWILAMARSATSIEKVKALGARPIMAALENVDAGMLKECDIVIHCAAYVEPYGTYQQFAEVNVEGTRRLLEAAKKSKVKQFIFIGTEAALFDGGDLNNIDETYPYPAHSPFPYSETKKLAEIMVLDANQPGVFETISIRPRLVWGPGDETILPNLTEMVDKGRFRWIDDGQVMTSSTHIDNLVQGVLLAMERGKGGQAYFITDHEVHTMKDFLTQYLATARRTPADRNISSGLVRTAAAILESIWKLFRIKRKPPVTRFSAAIMSANCTIASDKAKNDLGYEPVISVADGMKAMMK
jgi:nucleoside-diphosphate-sugar epimerase